MYGRAVDLVWGSSPSTYAYQVIVLHTVRYYNSICPSRLSKSVFCLALPDPWLLTSLVVRLKESAGVTSVVQTLVRVGLRWLLCRRVAVIELQAPGGAVCPSHLP